MESQNYAHAQCSKEGAKDKDVLNFGAVIAKGEAEEVKKNPEVIKAYLGSGDVADMRRRLGAEHEGRVA